MGPVNRSPKSLSKGRAPPAPKMTVLPSRVCKLITAQTSAEFNSKKKLITLVNISKNEVKKVCDLIIADSIVTKEMKDEVSSRDVMDMQIAGLLLTKNRIEFHLGPPQAKKFYIFDQNIGISQGIFAEII